MKKLLYLTDLYYPAKGRNYYEEDIFIAGKLMKAFSVALCHPRDSQAFEDSADLILFRNTGSVLGYKEIYQAFTRRVAEKSLRTFNSFDGKADMRGKDYLPELSALGYPVIPTVDSKANIAALPDTERFVIKPKDGADSIGLEFLTREELLARDIPDGSYLIQPAVDLEYEVSFYFINDSFQYAMYAPDKSRRWELIPFSPGGEDLSFAKKFISWNTITHGIQRVDACRTKNGDLLLVELEDLNPYLSIMQTSQAVQDSFIENLIRALEKC